MRACVQAMFSALRRFPLLFLFCGSPFALTSSFAVDRFVSLSGQHLPPFISWGDAATNIQAAIDAAQPSDTVWVAEGEYNSSVFTNTEGRSRVIVDKAIAVRSSAGPLQTLIRGINTNSAEAVRCVWLAPGAILSGFTLVNGGAYTEVGYEDRGGGAYLKSGSLLENCAIRSCGSVFGGGISGEADGVVSNSVIENNEAIYGGGVHFCVPINCVIQSNSASAGGGVNSGPARNCVIRGNVANSGGGVLGDDEFRSVTDIKNCLVTDNSAALYGGGAKGELRAYNCTFVNNHLNNKGQEAEDVYFYNSLIWVSGGTHVAYLWSCALFDCVYTNTTNVFRNSADRDYRLHPASPAIDAGSNGWLSADELIAVDLSGQPRLANDHVDAGAYEFQGVVDGQIPASWLNAYFLPTNQTLNFVDLDGDSYTTWQEYIAGTDPTNELNYFFVSLHAGDCALTWPVLSNRLYSLYSKSALSDSDLFLEFVFAPTNNGLIQYVPPLTNNWAFFTVGIAPTNL